MNKEQAIKIVRETFEAPFDKVLFSNFIKGLLNEPDFTEGFGPRTGNYIPDSFKGYIEKYERLGKYKDSEEKRLDILIVYLKRETSIERARSMQRNFIAGYLKGNYGSNNEKDAALVAFVSPNPEDWRFSLVKLDVRLEVDEKGKAKGKEEFTPAKRWSFLVGANEKSHTAQTQFKPILADDENNPTLEELEAAFNIEKVTDEFFKEYRRLFIETKEALDKAVKANPATKSDFEAKGINTVDLSKKLLGQIIFLYYLQKKGWFGVSKNKKWGDGSKNFLRELFTQSQNENKNFFNDVLEPLFYEALRIDRSHDDHYYKLFDCKIPFLNGGLFDPMNNYDWVNTEILLSNKLFSNQTKDDKEGDGILDVFDLYNFTVKEDEPFEKEVAIDPELLGKAYEKFNAIRPDNYDEFLKALKSGKKGDESKFNKQYGVYYTPREIVHYMCQQSLINYLYSELNPNAVYQNLGDDQLDLFGNATKSGQLDLSVEHPTSELPKADIEMLILRGEQIKENDERVLAAGKETDTYSFIMPDSIRQNASLIDGKLASVKVCDPAVGSGAFPVGMMSEIVKARDILTMYLNSKDTTSPLQGGQRGVYHFKRQCIENSLYGVDIDAGAVEIAKLRLWLSLIVDEDDIQNIKPLPNLDYKVVCGNSLMSVEKNLFNFEKFNELEEIKPLFIKETNITKKQSIKKKIDDLIIKIANGKETFDFEVHFSEVFHKNGGFDIVISNPPYVFTRGAHFEKETKDFFARHYIGAGGKVNLYALFIHLGIALVDKQGQSVMIIPNTFLRATTYESLRKKMLQDNTFDQIVDTGANVFEGVTASTTIITSKLGRTTNEIKIATLEKSGYEKNTNFVSRERFLKNTNFIIDIFSNNDSRSLTDRIQSFALPLEDYVIHLISGIQTWKVHKSNFISDTRINKEYKPLLEGKDIGAYTLNFKSKYIWYSKKVLNVMQDEEIFMAPEKILIQRISGGTQPLKATIDRDGYYCFNSINTLICKKLDNRYILGLLNSRFMNWFYGISFSNNSELTVNIAAKNLKKLPIYPVDFEKPLENERYKKITATVDRILAAKRANPQADTSKLESEIDALVYQLYGLTEDEVKIVEGK